MGDPVSHGRLVAAVEQGVRAAQPTPDEQVDRVVIGVRKALIEERLLEGLRDRILPPAAPDAELVVLGAAVAGEVDIHLLDELRIDDFWLPFYRWVLGRLRAGASGVSDLVAAARAEGLAGDGLRAEIEDLAMQPVLPPPITHHISIIIEMARRRRIIDKLRKICIKVELGDLTADEALDALAKMATKRRSA